MPLFSRCRRRIMGLLLVVVFSLSLALTFGCLVVRSAHWVVKQWLCVGAWWAAKGLAHIQ